LSLNSKLLFLETILVAQSIKSEQFQTNQLTSVCPSILTLPRTRQNSKQEHLGLITVSKRSHTKPCISYCSHRKYVSQWDARPGVGHLPQGTNDKTLCKQGFKNVLGKTQGALYHKLILCGEGGHSSGHASGQEYMRRSLEQRQIVGG
jgi:hypothetical protein